MRDRLSTPALDAALQRALALGEHSLQVAAFADGEPIVDAWAGGADAETVFPVFSASKGVTALAVHVQAERGHLELDAPVAHYWPEFGTRGKERITIAQVLCHRAGIPQMPPDVTPERLGDWAWIVAELESLEPLYEPGTTNAYHSMTFGWILGEVVSRTDPESRPFARWVAEELCAALGADAFWFGISPAVEPRVAELSFPDAPSSASAATQIAVPPRVGLGPAVFNRTDVHAASIPAVGGISDARSLARLFAPFAGASPLLSPLRVREMLSPRPDGDGDDLTYGRRLPVGVGGLWIEAPGIVPPGRPVLAHPGVGGSIGWAEPDTGLSAAICHDRMFGAPPEHPFTAIADAVRAAHDAFRPADTIREEVPR